MLRKYAAMQILESSAGTLSKQAHKHDFKYDVEPGYIYVVSRAISSRCNDNYDHFGASEIKKAYQSFIGKPVFVNHENDNHKRARGVIIDAALHEDKNRDGSPDTWVAVCMMIDAKTFPKLAQEILAGNIERTSMGVDVERSVCSACNNVATTPMEYCAHIPRAKGQMLYKHDQRTGAKSAHLIYESCYGLHFFENSLLVEPPADPTAFFLSVDARGVKGGQHEKTASLSPLMSKIAATQINPSLTEVFTKMASVTERISCCGRGNKKGRTASENDAPGGEANYDPKRNQRLWQPPQQGIQVANPHLIRGARAYASSHGLEDPHGESYAHVHTTPDRIARLAKAYDSLPMNDRNAHEAYDNMRKQIHAQSDHARNKMGISMQVVDHDPYKSVHEMAHDVQHNKQLKVLSTKSTGGHPFFSNEDNDHFRFVHDLFGHAATQRPFDRHGEEGAWLAHSKMFHGSAKHAMSTETRGQNSSLIANGDFPAQRIGLLPEDLLRRDANLKEAIKVVRPGPDDDDIPHEQLPDGHPGKDPFYVAHSHSTTGGNPDHGFGKGTYGEEANENHEGARPHHRNIVQSWNESTPDERHRGANWYKNAQFVGESLAKNSPRLKQDHGDEHGNVDNHTARARGAAVLAHHSAGVGWYHNMDNASETFRKGHTEGGKGRGRQITDVMAAKSNAVLDMPKGKNDYAHTFDNAVVSKQVGNARKKAQDEGRPEHEVRAAEEEARSGVKGPNPNGSYKNSPKTRNFAHLMEHGGDEDHDGTPSRRVVVDRHALSVAMGKRMGTQDMASWKSEGHHYDYIGNMYRRASDHISKQEGRHVPPHEVQAVTWLRQKRKNDEEDLQKVQQGSGRNKAQFNNGDNQQKQWHKTVDEHHPDLKGLRYGPGEHETDQHTEPVAKRPWNEGEEK